MRASSLSEGAFDGVIGDKTMNTNDRQPSYPATERRCMGMRELICAVLCAALRADRNAMREARMALHGYPQPYTDAVMCFGFDYEVDVSLFESILADAAVYGAEDLDNADPCEYSADFWLNEDAN